MTYPFSTPSGSFGNEAILSGLMDYGPQTPPQMSMAPAGMIAPLNFTGDTGRVANIGIGSGAGMMNYGMSPVPADMAGGLAGPAGTGGLFDGFFTRKNLLGGMNADGSKDLGVLPVGLGALQGLGSLYMGMQQYGLAKKQLSESKRQFDMNYGANKTLTNSRMEDRQRARVASNAGAYQSVDSYMAKNGVK